MKGGAFLFGRQIISMGLSFVGVMMITRVIGPESYGSYAAALGIYQYAVSLGQVGVGIYLVRLKGEADEREFGVAYSLLLALAAILIFSIEGGLGLISSWIHVKGFDSLLRILVLCLPFQLLAVPANARLERRLDYRRVAMIELAGQMTFYVVAVPMVACGYGAWSLACGWFVQQALASLLSHVLAAARPRFDWDRAIAVRVAGYAASLSFATWLWQLRGLVNPFIVGHFLGAESVGLVGLTIRLMEMLTFIKTIAWRLSIAGLARIQGDTERMRRAVTQGMQLQILAVGPILLGFGWAGGVLVPLIFGPRWLPMMNIYPFIALGYLTNSQFNMHSSVLSVLRRNDQASVFHIIHVMLFAGVTALAIPRLGLVGYGGGEIAALLSYWAIHSFVVRAIGSPDYRLSVIWWSGLALGLFWRQFGPWALAAPFLAVLSPVSLRQLKVFALSLRGRQGETISA